MVTWICVVMTSVMALGADGAPAGQRGPQAFGGGRGMQRGQQDMNAFAARVINAVGADEEQAKQLKAIAEEYNTAATNAREKMAALSDADRTKVRELHQKVREARRSGDDAAVADLQKEIHEITGSEPVPSPQDTYDRMADVLTDDQLPALKNSCRRRATCARGAPDRVCADGAVAAARRSCCSASSTKSPSKSTPRTTSAPSFRIS